MPNILVVLEQTEGKLHRMSREAIVAGQRLMDTVGGSVHAVLLGEGVGDLAEQIAQSAALESLKVIDDAALKKYTPGAYVTALKPLVDTLDPAYVIFPHTYQSVDYFPRLAQALGNAAIVNNVVSFVEQNGEIHWTRPVLGGKLNAQVRVQGEGPIFVSVQNASYSADDIAAGTAPVEAVTADSLQMDREILGTESVGGDSVDLSKANVIVAAGRGVGGEDKMKVVEELASALGAEIGASRPVIDNGWTSRDRQIGSSGQTVSPKLYFAVGISGAIQHIVGMKGAGCVVAINKDAGAPIFNVAQYGIVGDLHEFLPAITAELKNRE